MKLYREIQNEKIIHKSITEQNFSFVHKSSDCMLFLQEWQPEIKLNGKQNHWERLPNLQFTHERGNGVPQTYIATKIHASAEDAITMFTHVHEWSALQYVEKLERSHIECICLWITVIE